MAMYTQCSISKPEDLKFGYAPKSLTTRRGLIIGEGVVYPELNFTLPPMMISENTFPEIRKMYRSVVEDACRRAVQLESPGFVVEVETLIEMTTNPQYAIELTATVNEVLDSYFDRHGLKTALRITPNDTREMKRPPVMRQGNLLDSMIATFDGCAREGGEMLSIESTGGKEIHDNALLYCDIEMVIFALSVLGCRDMAFLWEKIDAIAKHHGTVAGGDTACAFGNTAMVLAEKKMIPRVFAAVVRAVTAVRSLVAYEKGAVGPGKDCGYENIYLKAITGYPMSMEGKVAACAHESPVGNIAAAACDLWSNESIQNVKLLGGMAPTVCLEQLVYDCRLMNKAIEKDQASVLQSLLVESDTLYDPQAFILSTESAVAVANTIVESKNHYAAAKAAALSAISLLEKGVADGKVVIPEMETMYLESMKEVVEGLPGNEDAFIESVLPKIDNNSINLEEYEIIG